MEEGEAVEECGTSEEGEVSRMRRELAEMRRAQVEVAAEEERRLHAAALERAEIMTSVGSERAALQEKLDAMAAQLAVAGQQQASLEGDVEARIAASEAMGELRREMAAVEARAAKLA